LLETGMAWNEWDSERIDAWEDSDEKRKLRTC